MKEKTSGPDSRDRFGILKATAKAFSREALGSPTGDIEKYGETAFVDRAEDEQIELFYKLHSLISENRDITRSLREYSMGSDRGKVKYEIKKMGSRMIRVPRPVVSEDSVHIERAIEKVQKRKEEVRRELNELGDIPGFEEMYSQKIIELYLTTKLASRHKEMETRREEIRAEMEELYKNSLDGTTSAVTGVDSERIGLLKAELGDLDEKEELFSTSEMGRATLRFLELKSYSQDISRGRIIELPSVSTVVEQGLEHMRAGNRYLLVGHLGSGKTEIARHIAKLYMIETGSGHDPESVTDYDELYDQLKPEFFSGSGDSSVYDLIGNLRLKATSSTNAESMKKMIDDVVELFLKMDVKQVPTEEIIKILLGKSDVTETAFSYGPMGRAIKNDVPIIMDELNMVPPEVLARLNALMLLKPGDKVRLQENGEEEFTVGNGFAILGSLNLGNQYTGLNEVNAAFKSRWIAREIDYPTIEETFDLIISSLIRKDRTTLPPDFPVGAYEQLVDLSVVVREVQDLFSGKTEGQRFMAYDSGVSAEKSQLEKSVISTRDLMRNIIIPWKKGNFEESLDEIIARNIIASEVFSFDDQRFLTELFIRRGFFGEVKEVTESKKEEETKKIKKEFLWDVDRFRAYGIHSVSQMEIDALRGMMSTEEYKKINSAMDQVRNTAIENSNLLKRGLSVGVKQN